MGRFYVLWIGGILDQREFSESVVGAADGCLSFQECHRINGGRLIASLRTDVLEHRVVVRRRLGLSSTLYAQKGKLWTKVCKTPLSTCVVSFHTRSLFCAVFLRLSHSLGGRLCCDL